MNCTALYIKKTYLFKIFTHFGGEKKIVYSLTLVQKYNFLVYSET